MGACKGRYLEDKINQYIYTYIYIEAVFQILSSNKYLQISASHYSFKLERAEMEVKRRVPLLAAAKIKNTMIGA